MADSNDHDDDNQAGKVDDIDRDLEDLESPGDNTAWSDLIEIWNDYESSNDVRHRRSLLIQLSEVFSSIFDDTDPSIPKDFQDLYHKFEQARLAYEQAGVVFGLHVARNLQANGLGKEQVN